MMQSRTKVAQDFTSQQMLQELHHVLESLNYEVNRIEHPSFIAEDGCHCQVSSYKMEPGLESLKDFLRQQHANIIYLYDVRLERISRHQDPFNDHKFIVLRCHIVT